MLEILQIINFIVTIATGAFALLFTVSKPFRTWLLDLKNDKKRKKEDENERKETDRCLLRDRITAIYFKLNRNCEIKQYEFENVEKLYHQYKILEGNSFIDKIWEEMQDWTITR